MRKVIIASQNPVKIEVTKQIFNNCFTGEQFEFIPIKAESGVSDQPKSEAETVQGAKNRVKFCQNVYPDADYFVGLEGGTIDDGKIMRESAFVVIEDSNGFMGIGESATFIVPTEMAKRVRAGEELGIANDNFFRLNNSKQAGGTIASLTDGIIDRVKFYFQPGTIALMQIKHKDWYK